MQSLLFATAQGTFLTGSAVFFIQVVGLHPYQVGLGLTIAGVVSFLVAYPAGRLVDGFGPKRMWAPGDRRLRLPLRRCGRSSTASAPTSPW